MNMSKIDQSKVMTAHIADGCDYPSHSIPVVRSFGRIRFWNGSSIRFEMDETFGPNGLSESFGGLMIVTVDDTDLVHSEQTPNLPAVKETTTVVQKIKATDRKVIDFVDNLGWGQSFIISGFFAALCVVNIALSVFSSVGFLFIFTVLLCGFMTGHWFSMGKRKHIAGEPVWGNNKKDELAAIAVPKQKYGIFPARSDYRVMTNIVAYKLINLLKTADSPLMNMLVEQKLSVETNHEVFKAWVFTVSEILSVDSEFPLDAIPLMNDETSAVLKELREQIAYEQKLIDDRKAEEARVTVAGNDEKSKVLSGFAQTDSEAARLRAEDYIQVRKMNAESPR